MSITSPSPWPWIDRPVSGLLPETHSPYSDSVSLRLPYTVNLATESKSLTHYTKGTQSPHTTRHPSSEDNTWTRRIRAPTACTHTGSGSISLPSPGFFSPFPHGTGSLSVGREYLALEDGPPMFSQDNTCPDLLIVTHNKTISSTGLSPAMAGLSRPFPYDFIA